MKWFTSDWHLGHFATLKFFGRPFELLEEMDDTIIKNIVSVVHPGDEIFFLGDLSWREDSMKKFLNQLPHKVQFHWILGNHDKGWRKYKSRVSSVALMGETKIQGHHVVLCHYPMLTWNRSHYGSWQLFGHHHQNANGASKLDKLTVGKMFNVNLEFNDYKMYSEDDIVSIMERKKDNWDFIKK